MFVAILIALMILAAAVGTYMMILSSRREDVKEWVAESVTNWRAEELKVDGFDVQMEDSDVGEIFHDFTSDSLAYYTPEDVESQLERIMSAEQGAVAQLKSRFHKPGQERMTA